MTREEVRGLGQGIVDVVDELGSTEATLAAVQTQLDSANATIQQAAIQRAAMQAQLDAITADEAIDEQKILDIQAAFDAYKASHPDTVTAIPLGDFTQAGAFGIYKPSGSLLGAGVDRTRTVYAQPAHIATKVPPTTGTNQNHLMMVGSLSSSTPSVAQEVGNFSLLGTDQTPTTPYYGGLRVGWSKDAYVHDVVVKGIPGYASGPPGETFSLATWHADNPRFSDVFLDGLDSNGNAVAATLFGANSHDGFTADRLVATNAKYGFAIAFWQIGGNAHPVVLRNCVLGKDNRKAINVENCDGGVWRFIGCDFRGIKSVPYIMQATTRSLSVSNHITLEDCIFDGDLCQVNTFGPSAVKDPATGAPLNGQKDADIRRIDNGVDVTGNLAKFKITHI